jgi:sporulation protein YlmC with PRC-barrel domain
MIVSYLDGGSMFINKILGKGVLDRNANVVGKVDDFEIDVESWTITKFVVRLGFIKRVSVGMDKIDKVGDKVILKITKEELGMKSLI